MKNLLVLIPLLYFCLGTANHGQGWHGYPITHLADDCATHTAGRQNDICLSESAEGIWYCPVPGDCSATTAWQRRDEVCVPDLSVPWTWWNNADEMWMPIVLRGGATGLESSYIEWQDYLGAPKWYFGPTGSNFQLYDVANGMPRIFFTASSNIHRISSSGGVHLVEGSGGEDRFTVLGDADSIFVGPNEDTGFTRTGAGVFDYSKATHDHGDAPGAGTIGVGDTTGTLGVTRGGTGLSTVTNNALMLGLEGAWYPEPLPSTTPYVALSYSTASGFSTADFDDLGSTVHTHLDAPGGGLLTFDAINEYLLPSKISPPGDDFMFLGAVAGVAQWKLIPDHPGGWKSMPSIPASEWIVGPRCDVHTETQIGGSGTQSPRAVLGHCTMAGGSGVNGYYFGVMPTPEDWDPTSDFRATLYAIAIVDPTATRITRGMVQAQCVTVGEVPASTWTNYGAWLIQWQTADVLWDNREDSSISFAPDGTCVSGSLIYWRIVVCDNIDSDEGDAGCTDGQSTSWPITSYVSLQPELWIVPN